MAKSLQNPYTGFVVQESFNLQGNIRLALEEFVVPVIIIGDQGPSMAPVIRRHAVATMDEAATASERPVIRFEAIGGLLCVIRKFFIRSSTGAATLSMSFPGNAASIGPGATVSPKSFTDGRLLTGTPKGSPQTPAGVLTTDTQVGALTSTDFQLRLPADGLIYEVPGDGWIIGTGHPDLVGFLEMQIGANNTVLSGSMEWDEYALV